MFMWLLSIFKSRKQKDFESTRQKIFNRVFPDGREQVNKELNDVKDILDSKYPADQIISMYLHMTTSFFLFKDKSEERIVSSSFIKTGGKIKKDDLVRVYNYIGDKFARQSLNLLGVDELFMSDNISDGMFSGHGGCDTDEIPGSYGKFGHSLTNPVPTKGIIGSNSYLGRLRLPSGEDIQWKRVGSRTSQNIKDVIDEYELLDKSESRIGIIFICPYHQRNSEKSPTGFILA